MSGDELEPFTWDCPDEDHMSDTPPVVPPTPSAPAAQSQGRLARNWHLITISFLIAGWAISAVTALRKGEPIPPPPDVAQVTPSGDDPKRPMGWVDNQDEVAKVVATLPIKVFRDTPAHQAMGVEPDHVYLWEQAKKARGGQHIPTLDQGDIGSCVGNGAENAVEYMECVGLVADGKNPVDGSKFRSISSEVIYGGSRVQIGGGQLKGQDGSTGAWAAQWCQKYGVVARGKYPDYDLSAYSVATCRKFGDDGCPASLIAEAKAHPVKSITQVKTTEELRRALANGYPVTVASNVGFGSRGPYVRDKDGFLRASGSWAHQMCWLGFHKFPNGEWGYYCMNSWGPSWVGGPAGPGDPPPGGFWVHESTAAKMLHANDSWAYSGLTGFLPQQLDWALAPQLRRNDLFALNPFGGLPCDSNFSLSP